MKINRINKHFVILVLLFISLVIFEIYAPKEPDWTPNFEAKSKTPYGTFILKNLLSDIFDKSDIFENNKSIYQFFNISELKNSTYIIINEEFKPDSLTLSYLLNFVNDGNKIFISANSFGKKLCDTLNFSSEIYYENYSSKEKINHNFVNKKLKNNKVFSFQKPLFEFYFNSIDTNKTTIIIEFDKNNANFISINYGKGTFYIHNQPFAFTNFNVLLNNNTDYVFTAFSYLKNDKIIWDEYFKPRINNNTTPLKYILNQKSLKLAWYLMLIIVFIFIIFSSKRNQRVIPIIKPLRNTSLIFSKTLANLYLKNKNHKDIALKKFNYWINFLRDNYHLNIEDPNKINSEKIAEKTATQKECIEKIISSIAHIKEMKNISSDELFKFNTLIEKFYLTRK
ncbi:MAG: hypothetical protein JXR51_11350 [Bacteroidales bacterium]|nr:hypothetical protein [Bacteroidales bacterium]MBN2757765.1 hypothetical protein [Bacteroidales bacterium]